jgi:hypothetical protein
MGRNSSRSKSKSTLASKPFIEIVTSLTPDFDEQIFKSVKETDPWVRHLSGKWKFQTFEKRRKLDPLITAIRRARREEAKKRKLLTVKG